jgi:hypothetical protein
MFGAGTLVFTGGFEEHAIQFGPTPAPFSHGYPSAQETNLRIVRARRPRADIWNESGAAGVALINVNRMTGRFWVEDFDIGLLLRGCEENRILLERFRNNRVAVRLHNTPTEGFSNANFFFGGSIKTDGATRWPGAIHGVEFKNDISEPVEKDGDTSGVGGINGNTFVGLEFGPYNHNRDGYLSAFHGSGPRGAQQTAAKNLVLGLRFEAAQFDRASPGAKTYLLSGWGIVDNEFKFSRGNPTVSTLPNGYHLLIHGDEAADNLTLATNRFTGPSNWPAYKDEPVMIARWTYQDFVKVSRGDKRAKTMAPGNGIFWDPRTQAFHKSLVAHEVSRSDAGDARLVVDSTSFPGILFDLRHVAWPHERRIDVKALLAEDGGRFAAVAFDENYQSLEDPAAASLHFDSSQSYKYYLGSELTIAKSETHILFGPNVAYAFVGISRSKPSGCVKELRYFALGQADIRVVHDQNMVERFVQTASRSVVPMYETAEPVADDTPSLPAHDIYSKGTFVRNIAPSELGSTGGKYIITGWTWSGTKWLENRALTGN